MRTAILLITHDNLGKVLIDLAKRIVDPFPPKVAALSIPFSCDTEEMYRLAKQHCDELEDGAGILILTDLYGSTPGNVAIRLYEEGRHHIVSGVNFPMLLRALNYSSEGLTELTGKVTVGGRDGIKEYKP